MTTCPNHPKRPSKVRGLCFSCYNLVFGRVKRGETTWQQLEAEGYVKPPLPGGRPRKQLQRIPDNGNYKEQGMPRKPFTREDFIEAAGGMVVAIETENAILSSGREFLPDCAQAVQDGEPATPDYWHWLIDQLLNENVEE